MDNLSHSLTGLAMARAGLNRLTPRATLLLLLSANIPDIDIAALGKSQFAYLEAHRGLTHSLVALPILAALCVALTAAIYRQRLPWFQAWLAAAIGVASHLLLDLTNSYGIRLLTPFSRQWFHLDINALTDGPILAALAVAAVWPWLSSLVSGEIGEARKSTGQGIAVAVLLLCCGFEVGRYTLHRRALAQLESRLYAGAPALQVAALPTAMNPFHWRGLVQTQAAWLAFNFTTLSQLNTESARTFFRAPPSEAIAAAQRTAEFSYFLYFARFPVWSVQPVAVSAGDGKRVDVTDLRFGEPGRGDFHCVALVNANGGILGSWFTFGSGSNLGWTGPARP
jgi:inner membrane protein